MSQLANSGSLFQISSYDPASFYFRDNIFPLVPLPKALCASSKSSFNFLLSFGGNVRPVVKFLQILQGLGKNFLFFRC